MNIQPLMTFEERVKQYRAALRAATLQQMLIGLPLCFVFFWLVSDVIVPMPLPWWALAPLAWCVLALPPVITSLPKKPHPDDIARDVALRRSAGIEQGLN